MERMAESIMNVATALPEGVPLAAKGLLHLGSRAAVDQTLSHLHAPRPDTLWSAQSVG